MCIVSWSLFPALPSWDSCWFFFVGLKPKLGLRGGYCNPPTPSTLKSLLRGLSDDGRSISSIIWKVGLHLSLDTSRTFSRCISMVFSRTRTYALLRSMLVAFSQLPDWLNASSMERSIKGALPFSFDVFGRFRYQQLQRQFHLYFLCSTEKVQFFQQM